MKLLDIHDDSASPVKHRGDSLGQYSTQVVYTSTKVPLKTKESPYFKIKKKPIRSILLYIPGHVLFFGSFCQC